MENYQTLKNLNYEPHSQVVLAIDHQTNLPIVLKQWSISASKIEGIDPFHELTIMQTLQKLLPPSNNSIIKMLKCFKEDDKVVIVLEYMSCDSIETALLNGIELTEEQVASIIYQIVDALDSLHTINIVHRDIKPSNFLLNMMGEVKLADFGVSVVALPSDQPSLSDFIGTPHYIPPEIASRQVYGPQCDIWSLGISVIELLLGSVPLCDTPGLELIPLLQDVDYNPLHQLTMDQYQQLSTQAREFISLCCQTDPMARPTPSTLKQHPFIAKNRGKKSPLFPICDGIGALVKSDHFSP